jgi:hypothetical protein
VATVSVSERTILKVKSIHTPLWYLLFRVDDGKRRDSLSKPHIAGAHAILYRCVSAIAAQRPFREMIIKCIREIIMATILLKQNYMLPDDKRFIVDIGQWDNPQFAIPSETPFC